MVAPRTPAPERTAAEETHVTTLPIIPCCGPVLEAPLDASQAEELATGFKVLADPVRLRLLSLIAAAPQQEACACDLVTPLGRSQPTVSHHLGVLTEAGLLTREQRGRWAYFRVDPSRLAVLRDALDDRSLARPPQTT
jgi:ArsR family transcriptional regulator, arsenate/arsenite/antimonite-responsive transcriptional repressor